MNSDEMFNWPDADVVLHCTHGTESRDFRVHKFLLSFTSPVFKDMFGIPQPPSSTSDISTVDLNDPPRALELILRFIYPSPVLPVINNLAIVSEALSLADKYDIGVARSRLRASLMEFTKSDPLRVYAIACRFGLEDEMKIASSYTISHELSELTQLPDEFKFVSAIEYHRLTHLRARYRKEVVAIAALSLPDLSVFGSRVDRGTVRRSIVDTVMKGTPLEYGPFTRALKTEYGVDVEAAIVNSIGSVLDRINALNLTV